MDVALTVVWDETRRMPVVLVPHGGPHSVTPHSFLPAYATLSLTLGCAIVHVNYRGSTGFGDK